MRKILLTSLFGLTLFTASCGTIRPATASESPTPALLPAPQTDASPTRSFLPNTPYSQNIRFEQLSLEEGLSQSVVNVILQDHLGFLWIGTEDGLNRYDGYGFKIYKPDESDPSSLSDRWITSLAEDPMGYLWIGTRLGGLNRYDPATGKFIHFLNNASNPESIENNMVTALLPDKDGMWVGTDNGLDFFDYTTGVFTHYRSSTDNQDGLSGNSISTLFKDGSGILWIGTSNAGLNAFDQKTKSFKVYKNDEKDSTTISSNRILSIEQDKDNRLWVGTSNGLNRLDTTNNTFLHFTNSSQNPDGISGNTIYVVYKDNSDGLWIGTNNGLDRYDSDSNKFIHHRHQATVGNSLSNDTVFDIYEDHNGVLWVGTYGGGLNKYNRQQDKFTYYRNNPDDPNSLSADLVFPILVETSGIVWIGTNDGGLNHFDPQTGIFTHYKHDDSNSGSIGSDDVIALESDRTGNLWVGTTHGLDRFDQQKGTFSHFTADTNDPNSLSGSVVYAIHEDRQGNLWVGTGKGLDLFDPSTQSFVHYRSDTNSPGSFSGNSVTTILDDKLGNLWVGTFDDGLKRITPNSTGSVIQYKNDTNNPASISNDSILCLLQDSKGNLWIGTAGGGLNLYDPQTDSFKHFTEKDGLPNNVIYGILEDGSGNLWLSTNFGLSRFDPIEKTFRNFTASDGLQSNEFNQNAYAKDNKGNLYFGGINGLNVFSPDKIEKNPIPPSIVLTSISHDGKALNQDVTAEALNNITLAWPDDSFEFEFAALAYGQPSKNEYSYMLENFDSNWITLGNQRNGRYTNLPGGTYTLRLRGSNSDGVWNNNGTSIKVTVIPPFWETWWFQSMMMLVVAAIIAGGLRWRVKSVEKRNRELEYLVQRRTADLEKRTGEIEALYEADERILRNVTLSQVFQTIVDVSVSMLKADRSVVFVWSDEQDKIVPRVSYGFRPETLDALKYNENEGLVGRVMATGKSITISDLNLKDLHGEIQNVIRSEGIQSFAHFPILVDGKVIAVFNVGYTRPNALNPDNIRLFNALVNRAELSIANMQLFEQTKDLAVMEERNRLARDLHDSAKQKAFAALAQLGTANGISRNGTDGIQLHLTEAETLIYEVIQELTFLIQEIYPMALQDKGLPTTLREYIFEWENRNDAIVNLTIQNERPLPLETEQAVYRVIQEALANVSRHSKANHVDISLVYNPDSLQVMIMDNGQGFDMNQKAKGMGLRSMRERIGSIRGTIQVQSAPGQGTRVLVQLPIKVYAGVERV